MGNFERGEELTLEDGSVYLIVDAFKKDDKEYLYIISESDEKVTTIVEVRDDTLYRLKDEKEFNDVYNELVERNREEINKYLEEINEN